MTCDLHDAPLPCPFCEWAASGDAVKGHAAEKRANRVAGRPNPPGPPATVSAPRSPSKRKAPRVSARVSRAMTCLYRECLSGCQGTVCHWRASLPAPNHAKVTITDCLHCIDSTRSERTSEAS